MKLDLLPLKLHLAYVTLDLPHSKRRTPRLEPNLTSLRFHLFHLKPICRF